MCKRVSKKEIVAMILAGGQGSRLGVLTKKLAKPAVPYGGKYRIIDFPLSNCSNSGIYSVGVLTQYKPLELNAHIGIGSPWDLDRKDGGVRILPPYQEEKGGNWYKGTANAIYQNIEFIDSQDPDYVLILSGDHIYKMDYDKMLQFHKEKNAEATIAVIEVPMEEACRFGIMNTNDDLSIYEFEEKPANPKSNMASMGVYIFNWKVLRQALKDDEKDKESSNDFGKNIIPKLLNEGRKLVAYPFKGYWKDVGTVDSLWEANMDLLKDKDLDLYNIKKDWKIYTEDTLGKPQIIGEKAEVKNSLVTQGCMVNGTVEGSVLFNNVNVGEGAKVVDSVLMPGVLVEEGAEIYKAIIDENVVVKAGTVINSEAKEVELVSDNSR